MMDSPSLRNKLVVVGVCKTATFDGSCFLTASGVDPFISSGAADHQANLAIEFSEDHYFPISFISFTTHEYSI